MHTDQLRIASPCDQDWDAMEGNSRSRYCGHCDETVHDLSAMTPGEAADLLNQARCAGAELCVRYTHRPDGAVLFAPDLQLRRQHRGVVKLVAATALAYPLLGAVECSAPPPPAELDPRFFVFDPAPTVVTHEPYELDAPWDDEPVAKKAGGESGTFGRLTHELPALEPGPTTTKRRLRTPAGSLYIGASAVVMTPPCRHFNLRRAIERHPGLWRRCRVLLSEPSVERVIQWTISPRGEVLKPFVKKDILRLEPLLPNTELPSVHQGEDGQFERCVLDGIEDHRFSSSKSDENCVVARRYRFSHEP